MSTLRARLIQSRAVLRGNWIIILFSCAAAAVFASQCWFVGDARIDDAYITFSFSKNVALGHGPVYSHDVRVEGYSTFLWMILVSLPMLITRGVGPLMCARIMAVPFVFLLGWSVYCLARLCGASRRTAGASLLLLSFNTDLVVGYLTGMETLPYVALLVFAAVATLRSFNSSGWERLAPWAGLAVALMRIDGFVPWGAFLGAMLLRMLSRRGGKGSGHVVTLFAAPLAVYTLWFFWRWHYYGLPLPSTYYAKELIPKLLPQRGAEYVWSELTSGGLWCGLLGWLWLLWRRRLAASLIGCYVLIHCAYVVKVGGDWMPFGRFVLPIVPFVTVLLVVAAADVVAGSFRQGDRFRWLTPIVPAVLVCLAAARFDHRFLNNELEEAKVRGVEEQTRNVNSYIRAAEFLSQVVPPNGRLVTDYGGVFGCYTDAAIIEMWGLANATIATRGGTEGANPIYGRTCPECYPELQPEYFHVMQPMVRLESAFSSTAEVIANVWQTGTIGRYIDFQKTFVVGRATAPNSNEALYFLQKRDANLIATRRTTGRGFVIDYPFEKQL